MMLLFLHTQKTILIIGWLSFALVVLFVLYRLLIRKLKQKQKDKLLFNELYVEVHPIEKEPASGTVPIYIEAHNTIEMQLHIFSPDKKTDKIIDNRLLKKGGNLIQFDTTAFQNGIYFYEVLTANQKTKKKIIIKN